MTIEVLIRSISSIAKRSDSRSIAKLKKLLYEVSNLTNAENADIVRNLFGSIIEISSPKAFTAFSEHSHRDFLFPIMQACTQRHASVLSKSICKKYDVDGGVDEENSEVYSSVLFWGNRAHINPGDSTTSLSRGGTSFNAEPGPLTVRTTTYQEALAELEKAKGELATQKQALDDSTERLETHSLEIDMRESVIAPQFEAQAREIAAQKRILAKEGEELRARRDAGPSVRELRTPAPVSHSDSSGSEIGGSHWGPAALTVALLPPDVVPPTASSLIVPSIGHVQGLPTDLSSGREVAGFYSPRTSTAIQKIRVLISEKASLLHNEVDPKDETAVKLAGARSGVFRFINAILNQIDRAVSEDRAAQQTGRADQQMHVIRMSLAPQRSGEQVLTVNAEAQTLEIILDKPTARVVSDVIRSISPARATGPMPVPVPGTQTLKVNMPTRVLAEVIRSLSPSSTGRVSSSPEILVRRLEDRTVQLENAVELRAAALRVKDIGTRLQDITTAMQRSRADVKKGDSLYEKYTALDHLQLYVLQQLEKVLLAGVGAIKLDPHAKDAIFTIHRDVVTITEECSAPPKKSSTKSDKQRIQSIIEKIVSTVEKCAQLTKVLSFEVALHLFGSVKEFKEFNDILLAINLQLKQHLIDSHAIFAAANYIILNDGDIDPFIQFKEALESRQHTITVAGFKTLLKTLPRIMVNPDQRDRLPLKEAGEMKAEDEKYSEPLKLGMRLSDLKNLFLYCARYADPTDILQIHSMYKGLHKLFNELQARENIPITENYARMISDMQRLVNAIKKWGGQEGTNSDALFLTMHRVTAVLLASPSPSASSAAAAAAAGGDDCDLLLPPAADLDGTTVYDETSPPHRHLPTMLPALGRGIHLRAVAQQHPISSSASPSVRVTSEEPLRACIVNPPMLLIEEHSRGRGTATPQDIAHSESDSEGSASSGPPPLMLALDDEDVVETAPRALVSLGLSRGSPSLMPSLSYHSSIVGNDDHADHREVEDLSLSFGSPPPSPAPRLAGSGFQTHILLSPAPSFPTHATAVPPLALSGIQIASSSHQSSSSAAYHVEADVSIVHADLASSAMRVGSSLAYLAKEYLPKSITNIYFNDALLHGPAAHVLWASTYFAARFHVQEFEIYPAAIETAVFVVPSLLLSVIGAGQPTFYDSTKSFVQQCGSSVIAAGAVGMLSGALGGPATIAIKGGIQAALAGLECYSNSHGHRLPVLIDLLVVGASLPNIVGVGGVDRLYKVIDTVASVAIIHRVVSLSTDIKISSILWNIDDSLHNILGRAYDNDGELDT